jgi:pimeloyl-ACP methyl ester carboxylesterase
MSEPLTAGERRDRVRIAGRHVETMELEGDRTRPALVLMHEGLGSVRLWRSFPRHLQRATGRRVIAFSRFGHGHSDPPPRPRTPAFFHEEALEVLPPLLAALDAPEPLLVGHSDGASIALIYASRRRVQGLALIAPHVVAEDVTLAAIRETRRQFEQGDLRSRLERHHDDVDAAFWGWCAVWLDPEFGAWSLERDAEAVLDPLLLIQGAKDPYGTLEQLDRIESRVAGPVRRLVLPGGHSPQFEHPEAVIEAIARFATELDGR